MDAFAMGVRASERDLVRKPDQAGAAADHACFACRMPEAAALPLLGTAGLGSGRSGLHNTEPENDHRSIFALFVRAMFVLLSDALKNVQKSPKSLLPLRALEE